MDDPALSVLIAGVFGAMVGSFLNVCIYRLPRRMSLVHPPSHCAGCGAPVGWYRNIPIVSFAWLRGRCARCGAPIGWQHPLVELTTALVFAAAVARFDGGLLVVSRVLFASALIVLFCIDLQHRILPNVITIPGIVVGVAFSLFTDPGWQASIIGALAGAGSLFAIAEGYYRVRHEAGLGMGDVKMLGMIGAFLGWKLMLLTLMLASLIGSLVGVSMMIFQGRNLRYALPFGTFLAAGAFVAMFAGDSLVDWYVGFYG